MTTEEEAIKKEVELLKYQRATLNAAIKAAKLDFEWSAKPPTGTALIHWYEAFVLKIIRAGQKNLSRFLITSPDVACLLEQTKQYRSVIDNNTSGIFQKGVLGSLYVFVDPYFPTNYVLLGAGTLDDPENLVIRDPVLIKANNLYDW